MKSETTMTQNEIDMNSESEQSPTSAQEKDTKQESGMIKQIHDVESTPFQIIQIDDGKCFITIGNLRISDFHEKETCEQMIQDYNWNLITNMITALAYKTAKTIVNEVEPIKETYNL